mmetsp:Transcript_60282/g.143248  ORF Transcript_60282/g.143248 Transcript_60282/m.143248 type:complete len:307 (-) Transcript_60282:61-981(-)
MAGRISRATFPFMKGDMSARCLRSWSCCGAAMSAKHGSTFLARKLVILRGSAPLLTISAALAVQRQRRAALSGVGSKGASIPMADCTTSRSPVAPASPSLYLLMPKRSVLKTENSFADAVGISPLMLSEIASWASSLPSSSVSTRGSTVPSTKATAFARPGSSFIWANTAAMVAVTSFVSAASSAELTAFTSASTSLCSSCESTPTSFVITALLALRAMIRQPSIALRWLASDSSKRSMRMSRVASMWSGNLTRYFGSSWSARVLHLGPTLALSSSAWKSAACSGNVSTASLASLALQSTRLVAAL